MEHGVAIVVHSGGVLTIAGSHLYSCTDMWRGIIVEEGGQLIIDQGTLHDNSFIEDAEIAVKLDYPHYDYAGFTGDVLSVNNTVFNRNKIGIDFGNSQFSVNNQNNFYVTPSTGTIFFPVTIRNSIFTCREIYFKAGLNDWFLYEDFKNTSLTLGTTYPATPETSASPYIEEGNYPSTTTDAYLKNPHSGEKSTIGINAYCYNSNNGTYKIGDENNTTTSNNVTIFDNQTIGVKLNSTDVKFENCTFQNTPGANPDINTYGILAEHYDEGNFYIDTRSQMPPFKPVNAFFDCRYGIVCNFYTHMNLENAIIRSSKTAALASVEEGWEGISVKTSSFGYDIYANEIKIKWNEIVNVAYGINLKYDDYPWGASSSTVELANPIEVNDNWVDLRERSSGSFPWTTSNFVEQGINLEVITPSSQTANVFPPLLCNRNHILGSFHGIRISNWVGKDLRVLANEIHLNLYDGIASTTSSGIDVLGCVAQTYGSFIYRNRIVGVNVNSALNFSSNLSSGIKINNGGGLAVKCNTVGQALKPMFQFTGSILYTFFLNNLLWGDHDHGGNWGMYLDGIIGQQGHAGYACDNDYVPNTAVNFWPYSSYKTMSNADASLSTMFVQLATTHYDPSPLNGVSSGFLNSPYDDPIFGTLKNGAANNMGCPNLADKIIMTDEGEFVGFEPDTTTITDNDLYITDSILITQKIEEAEMMAQGRMPQDSSREPQLRTYVAQMELYQMLLSSKAKMAKSKILQSFIQQCNGGSFGTINNISKSVMQGDTLQALQQLANWNKTNRVDSNYADFLSWSIMRRQKKQLNLNAIARLALQCPQTDGNVVFAAQNLYNAVTNEHRVFPSPCDLNHSLVTKQSNKIESKQTNPSDMADVSVYPNPANSFVFVSGKHLQQIELLNSTGALLTKQKVNSNNTEISLQTLSKGFYFIKATMANGKVIVRKIVKAN